MASRVQRISTLSSRHDMHVLNDSQEAGTLKKIVRGGMVGEQRNKSHDLSGSTERMQALAPKHMRTWKEARGNRQKVEIPLSRRGVKRR